MKTSFKNKNILVIVFEILVIALGVGGITFATNRLLNNRTLTILTIGEYNIDFVGNQEIVANNLEPISDELINIDTKENVIRSEFSLRSVDTNKREDLIYDVILSDMNIDCSLLNKYTKWNLYKNGSLLSTGSLDPLFDGNVLDNNLRLTNIQEDLPKYNEEYDDYVFIMWISEACDNLETCELVDQSNIVNSEISLKLFIALYGGRKKAYERVSNYDTSCANKPILSEKMVPVTYKDGYWVVADKNNSTIDSWYDYGNKKWANAVIVNNTKYKVGEKIDNSSVLGYYVWIPRYRYKLWNVDTKINDSYNAYDNGIDIIFETGLSSTDNMEYKNDDYMTHPAFSDNLKGIWVSKYEISKDGDSYKSIPNVETYTNDSFEELKSITNNLINTYDINDLESHMINNLEWGSALYLSHSKYGVCQNNGCNKYGINDSYVSGSNKQDTTSGSVFGIYDMAGASREYVIGSLTVGSATKEVLIDSGFTWYNSFLTNAENDYYLRGGKSEGLFYTNTLEMTDTLISTRNVLINKN